MAVKDPFQVVSNDDTDNVTEGPWDDSAPDQVWSLTMKGGAGYDAPWLVGKVGSLESAEEILSKPDLLKSVMDKLRAAGAYFSGGSAAPASKPGAPPANESNGETKSCNHGTMTPRSGFKNGKAWSGFFCPTPQGTPDQCKPIFNR